MKKTNFTATYIDGSKEKWSFYRCPHSKYWFLVDPDGYERTLEKTWIDSVPRIQLQMENHGLTANIS